MKFSNVVRERVNIHTRTRADKECGDIVEFFDIFSIPAQRG